MKNNLKLWHLKSVFTCGDLCDNDYEDEGVGIPKKRKYH